MSTTEELFEKAVSAMGSDYLTYERQLRHEDNRTIIQKMKVHPDAVGRLLAAVILSWRGEQGKAFDKALKYLYEDAPNYAAETAIMVPPPTGVSNYLSKHFGNQLTQLLTLRLVKDDSWEDWCVTGVLLYLGQHKDPETSEGLIRFAADTPSDSQRSRAVEILSTFNDQSLLVKLEEERKRREKLGLSMPHELEKLIF